jgi:hypothetical protein
VRAEREKALHVQGRKTLIVRVAPSSGLLDEAAASVKRSAKRAIKEKSTRILKSAVHISAS